LPVRDPTATEDTPVSYARAVGEKLRDLRHQQGLALLAVEEASGREFKAAMLGAYERGDRTISVSRLQRLAHLYGVPVDRLLPGDGPAPSGHEPAPSEPVRIGLTRLADLDSPDRDVLQRYVNSIQIQRGDFNGWVITIRDADVRALGWIFDSDEASMRARLRELHVPDRPPSTPTRQLGLR
jgi:transcriptional regulator with XRE-family HTH domain